MDTIDPMKTFTSKIQESITLFAVNFLIFVIFLGTLELLCYSLLKFRPLLSSIRSSLTSGILTFENDGRVNSPIYIDKEIARKIFQEEAETRIRYEPYNIWSLEKTIGATINVDGLGRRKTCQSNENTEEAAKKIFMFGGSTMFGTGSEDCETIPSLLALELSKHLTQ